MCTEPKMASEVCSRFTVHYTPTHRSGRNPAEIEIGIFLAAMFGQEKNPRSQDAALGSEGLESPNES